MMATRASCGMSPITLWMGTVRYVHVKRLAVCCEGLEVGGGKGGGLLGKVDRRGLDLGWMSGHS